MEVLKVQDRILNVALICILIITSAVFAYAAENTDISIMSDNYRTASADLDICNGTATVRGSLNGIPGTTTKVTVHLYLQQYKNGEWINYGDWLQSEDSIRCSITKTISVTKGYKYRAKASCYAYSVYNSEHIIKYSSASTY